MIDVFFNGYDFWFYRHKRSQRTYKISCTSDIPVLMPLPDEEMHCFGSVKSIGYFSLIREDEIAYKTPQNLLTVNVLVPLPDLLIEHNERSTFINLTENLSLGFAGINANNCRFIIDTKQPYDIKFDNKDNQITNDHLFVDSPIKNKVINSETLNNIDAAQKTADSKELSEDQLEKLKSLNTFIIEFGVARKNSGLDFCPGNMKCNEDDLFIALKKWAKKRDIKTQKLWDIKKLSNLDIWPYKQRKDICRPLLRGRSAQREKDFFKIVGF